MDIKWNKGENDETDISGHFFCNTNFPRSFFSAVCRQNDVVSAQHDGNDDGKADDVPSDVLLVFPNILDFHHAGRDHSVNLGHPQK